MTSDKGPSSDRGAHLRVRSWCLRARGGRGPDSKQLKAAYAKADQEHDSADNVNDFAEERDEPARENDRRGDDKGLRRSVTWRAT